MGRGFGRGKRAVVVTHSQTKSAGKRKVPRGLRGVSRKKRREKYRREAEDEQTPIRVERDVPKKARSTPIEKQIAAVYFKELLPGRHKGLKKLRKEIVKKTKDLRRRQLKQLRAQRSREDALAASAAQ